MLCLINFFSSLLVLDMRLMKFCLAFDSICGILGYEYQDQVSSLLVLDFRMMKLVEFEGK